LALILAPFIHFTHPPHRSSCQHQQLHSLLISLFIRSLSAALQSRLALCQRGLWWWRVGTPCYVARSVEVIFSPPANVDPQFSLLLSVDTAALSISLLWAAVFRLRGCWCPRYAWVVVVGGVWVAWCLCCHSLRSVVVRFSLHILRSARYSFTYPSVPGAALHARFSLYFRHSNPSSGALVSGPPVNIHTSSSFSINVIIRSWCLSP